MAEMMEKRARDVVAGDRIGVDTAHSSLVLAVRETRIGDGTPAIELTIRDARDRQRTLLYDPRDAMLVVRAGAERTDDAGILAAEWEIDEGGHTWCDRCLAAFAEQHEAGCHCDACLDAIARHWQGEADRAMETVPDRLP